MWNEALSKRNSRYFIKRLWIFLQSMSVSQNSTQIIYSQHHSYKLSCHKKHKKLGFLCILMVDWLQLVWCFQLWESTTNRKWEPNSESVGTPLSLETFPHQWVMIGLSWSRIRDSPSPNIVKGPAHKTHPNVFPAYLSLSSAVDGCCQAVSMVILLDDACGWILLGLQHRSFT